MSIRWITETLGTAAAEEVRGLPGLVLVDVRDLVDKAGNSPEVVREKIELGVAHQQSGEKTVVCCDYGISRSNAVAAGILAVHANMAFLEAVRVVQQKTGEKEIKLGPLEVVRRAIGEPLSRKSEKQRRTYLVTGATGFVGAAVCKRLESQFEIIAPARGQLDIESGSTELSLLVAEHDVDCILHFANPRVYTSNVSLGKTLTMLRNVLDVCVVHNISLVYPSGWEIFSGYEGDKLADETLPALPSGPYGETKYLAELLIQQFQRKSDLKATVIRSGPIYGAGSDRPKFIYNFINKARNSEPIITHRYINGDASLDLLHINDFVDAIFRICMQDYVGTVHVGSGTITSTRAIAEMLKRQLGSQSQIEQVQIDSFCACITMNYEKAKSELGWQPTITISEGLAGLLESATAGDSTV